MSFHRTLICLLGLGFFTATTASATLISGELNITLAATFSGGMNIDILPPGTGFGDFLVGPSTGSFAPLVGTEGQAKDLTDATAPVGVPFSLPNLLTFAAFPGLTFELRFVEPGVFGAGDCLAPAAAGQNCTVPGTAFNLTNTTATTSSASFTVRGMITDGSGDIPSEFVGLVTAQFANRNYQQLLQQLSVGVPITTTASASFNAVPIPEPATGLFFLTAGALLVGLGLRKRA